MICRVTNQIYIGGLFLLVAVAPSMGCSQEKHHLDEVSIEQNSNIGKSSLKTPSGLNGLPQEIDTWRFAHDIAGTSEIAVSASQSIAFCDSNGFLCYWSLADGSYWRKRVVQQYCEVAPTFVQSGLCVCTGRGLLSIYDQKGYKLSCKVLTTNAPQFSLAASAYSVDGIRVVLFPFMRLAVYNTEESRKLFDISLGESSDSDGAIDDDGSIYLVVRDIPGKSKLMRVSATGRNDWSVALGGEATVKRPSVTEGRIAVSTNSGLLHVFDSSGRALVETELGQRTVCGANWIDSSHVAIGTDSGELHVINIHSKEMRSWKPVESQIIQLISQSRGSNCLVVAEQCIVALNSLTGKVQWSYPYSDGYISRCTPLGKQGLVFTTREGKAIVLDLGE